MVLGRDGGPEFLDSELARLGHLVALAASISSILSRWRGRSSDAREAAASSPTAPAASSYDALLVLGSGWAPAVETWGEPLARLLQADVPHFRAPVAEGHRGELLAFDLDGVAVLVQSGRTHLYEGHGPRPVVHGVRTAAALGARVAVLTNANGSLRTGWEVGTTGPDQRPPQPHRSFACRGRSLRRSHRRLVTAAARDRPSARPDRSPRGSMHS